MINQPDLTCSVFSVVQCEEMIKTKASNEQPVEGYQGEKKKHILPLRLWEHEADLGGDNLRTGPEIQGCWSPAAAGRWRTGTDYNWTQ